MALGAAVALLPRGERGESVPAAEAGRRERSRGTAGTLRAPLGGGTLEEDRGLGRRLCAARGHTSSTA